MNQDNESHSEVYNPETGRWEDPKYWGAPKDYFYKIIDFIKKILSIFKAKS